MRKASDLFELGLRPIGAALTLGIAFFFLFLSVLSSNDIISDPSAKLSFKDRLLKPAISAENWFYDIRNRNLYVGEKTPSPNLVILTIDDKSLAEIGRWPWSRSVHGRLLDILHRYGVRTVAFDSLFPEPEKGEGDTAFAQAIENFQSTPDNHVIVGYGLTDDPDNALAPNALFSKNSIDGPQPKADESIEHVSRLDFLAPALQAAKPSIGFIQAHPDPDGVFRHVQVVVNIDGFNLPSLGFSLFKNQFKTEHGLEVSTNLMRRDPFIHTNNGKTARTILLNDNNELKVRFYGTDNAFRTISIKDIFHYPDPTISPYRELLKDKAVLIGSTALGANDLRNTPVSAAMPGLYMHANLFHMFDQNYFFQNEDTNIGYSLLLLLFGVACIIGVSFLHHPLIETLVMLGIALGSFFVDKLYFTPHGYFIRLFSCEFAFLGIYSWFTVLNLFHEAKEKKQIRNTFTRYVAPAIVKEMLAHPEKLHVGGEKRELTMLFSDVRDFTTISESLSPQDLSSFLNIYMGKMTDILFETNGTLDKYIGDALVGFWGAPVAVPEQAYQALKGAERMLEALPAINKIFAAKNFPAAHIGIGLNTGEVSVGNMGSDRIFAYTALGDHMNLASRLESLTKQYGANLLLSDYTYQKLGAKRAEFALRPIDTVQVKGKSTAVKIFELLPSWHPLHKEKKALEEHHKAYDLYLARDFTAAEKIWQQILSQFPEDKTSLRLFEAAKNLQKNPPAPDWSGVTVFTTK